jgi:hypothetical protein
MVVAIGLDGIVEIAQKAVAITRQEINAANGALL